MFRYLSQLDGVSLASLALFGAYLAFVLLVP
jgi:hypothetical protein